MIKVFLVVLSTYSGGDLLETTVANHNVYPNAIACAGTLYNESERYKQYNNTRGVMSADGMTMTKQRAKANYATGKRIWITESVKQCAEFTTK